MVAKSNAYDSVLALNRARAAAYDMNADESRFLTDPARAAAYEQGFIDIESALGDYDLQLKAAAEAHRADHSDVPFGSFLGDELRNIIFPGEQGAAERVLDAFRQYQLDDRTTRALRARGRFKEAVTFNTGLAARPVQRRLRRARRRAGRRPRRQPAGDGPRSGPGGR
ncbi:hypothetical protein [Kitasatospora sp. KL5]|uniref:hypothetical protein n=1 Tax=Kitasatospora sp. KL5 TaxID=3425125 RepID=UPI003D6F14F8